MEGGNRFGAIRGYGEGRSPQRYSAAAGHSGVRHGVALFTYPLPGEWGTKREQARREGAQLWAEIQARARVGRRHETLLTAGQTSGGIKEILPVAEIIRQLSAE